MSTPILWYKLSEDTVDLGTDSSANLTDMNNSGVVSINDATYGPVADFSAGTLTLPSANVPSALTGGSSRSYSFWVESAVSGDVKLVDIGTRVNVADDWNIIVFGTGIRVTFFNIPAVDSSPTVLVAGQWYHVVVTFEDVGNIIKIYIDGSEELSATKGVATSSTDLEFGQFDAGFQDMRLLDMRIYDVAIDATEVSNLFGSGPEQAVTVSIEATMFTHLADLTWTSIGGATSYTITQTEDAGSEETIVSETTDLSFTSLNLNPGSSYVFNLYTDLDLVTPATSITESALVVDTTNVTALAVRLSNDFSILSESSYDEVDSQLRNFLMTGDEVTLSSGNAIFVEDSDTITHSDTDILTPFESTAGSGQTITVTVGGESAILTYDESLNEVTYDGTAYGIGESFAVGTSKVTISEI